MAYRAAQLFHRAALPELDTVKFGPVFLYVDFTVPVAELRKHFEEVVRASKLGDGRVQVLQVTDLKESTMEIRVLASASSSGRTFDLRCEVREKIAYVQKRYPEALPRVRADLRDQRSRGDVKTTAHVHGS